MKKPNFRTHFPVTKTQLDFVNQATNGLNQATRWVFCHILHNTFKVLDRDGWIPISYKAAQKDYRTKGFNHEQLKTTPIEFREHDRERSLSREYKIKEEWVKTFLSIGLTDAETVLDLNKRTEWFNVFTEMPIKRRVGRKPKPVTVKTTKSIADEAAKVLTFCPLNNNALTEYKRLTLNAYEKLLGTKLTDDEREAIEGKRSNILYCTNFISSLDLNPTDKVGIYRVEMEYEVQDYGRLYLPLQHAPRVMKHFMYQSTDTINYDVNACHTRIALQQLKSLDLPHKNLEEYVTDNTIKEQLIKSSGLDESTWKICFFALLNGAGLPRNLYYARENNVLRRRITKAVGKEKVTETYSQFRRAVKPLYEEAFAWLQYLGEEYIYNPANITKAGSRLYVTNAVNKKLDVTKIRSFDKGIEDKARDLASFFLQGYEAAFIHKLTLLGPLYGYQPVANEHDGLITIGEIPPEAIKEAEKYAGIENLVLKSKPYCSESELIEWQKLVNG